MSTITWATGTTTIFIHAKIIYFFINLKTTYIIDIHEEQIFTEEFPIFWDRYRQTGQIRIQLLLEKQPDWSSLFDIQSASFG